MAIYEVYKEGQNIVKTGKIKLRDEQKKAVHDAKAVFSKPFSDKRPFHKFLWNAKMRFGKTLCAMQLAKEMSEEKGITRTLIVTHRPVVNKSWAEDFEKIFEKSPHWQYGTKFEKDDFGNFDDLEKFVAKSGNHYVFFASMQYLRRSELVNEGGDNDPLKKKILQNNWDLVVIDEAHEGTLTVLGSRVVAMLSKPKMCVLHLSGTPFNLYDNFDPGEIFTWDYIAEQKAKREWAEKYPMIPNPYAELPEMKIFTYDLGRLVKGDGFVKENAGFMFSEFFRTWTGNSKLDGAAMPSGAKGKFVHEKSVSEFLDLLCKEDETSNYPFSKDEYRLAFNHTLWVVPGVKEAKALEKLLKQHDIFKHFSIVNVAGDNDDDEASENALDELRRKITRHGRETNTITLSCGRLTTGVTVREWSAVFYLKGSENTSASTYMQTIFRAQTPYEFEEDGIKKCKAMACVFDFAPDRSLKMLAEAARFFAKTKNKDKLEKSAVANQRELNAMKELLDFCPVIAYEGGEMKQFEDANALFAKLSEAKIDRVVQRGFDDTALYNIEELLKMDPNAVNNLRGILGKTKGTKEASKIDLSTAGLTGKKPKPGKQGGEEEDEPEEEDAEAKKAKAAARKERDNRIAILRGVSLRIPLLMFGAEVMDEDKDVTLDNFTDEELIDEASWTEFMPRGFTRKNFDEIKSCYDPVVFKDSWKRYRQMAREADFMPIEDRIKAITTIFGYFHNPDKETVLTRWRVVNMHMSDTIGGWCFYNKKFDGPNLDMDGNETTAPRWVEQNDVTKDIFCRADKNGDTPVRILEINSKTGLYPLYVTYSLYRSILPTWMKLYGEDGVLSLKDEQALWDKILQENIFVICNTQMAALITERTLRGFRKVNGMHIKPIRLVEEAKTNQEALVKKLNSEKFWFGKGTGEMKFNAVVGNPPYQVMGLNEGNRDNPIYHLFMDVAFSLAPRATLITPGRFLFDAGQTPKAWNRKMLSDQHLKVVRYWQKSDNVFPNVDIKGGVAITYRDSGVNFGAIGSFTTFPELNTILHKVLSVEGDKPMLDSIVSPRGHFRFSVKAFSDHPEIPKTIGAGTGNMIASNAFDKLPSLFHRERPAKGDYVEMIGRDGKERVSRFMRRDYLEENEYLGVYKVFVPEANGTGAIGEILSTPMLGEPMIGSTDTFISVGRFSASCEAENCMGYIKTRFARTMLGILKATQHNPRSTWRYVPLQDFSKPWTDKELYKKYKLSDAEIKFIESMIKPMV